MSYHVRGLMSFRPNDQCYGQNRGIVCDNVPILCTHVHLGMKNNVAVGSFPFHRTKISFFIFRVPKTEFFVKQPPNGSFQMHHHILSWKSHFKFKKMIWMSYLDSSHFSDLFRHIICQIRIYGLKNINYYIFNKKTKKVNSFYFYLNSRLLLLIHCCLLK